MAVIALITARSGSKRLPFKNVLPFSGKPMLLWTLEAALDSECFDEVVVSSDDHAVLDLAYHAGAQTTLRDEHLSTDDAGLIDVLTSYLASRVDCMEICLLLPNCPLRTSADIVGAFRRFRDTGASAVLSTVDYGWTPPFRALVESDGDPKFYSEEWKTKKSQLYPRVVCPSGAIYFAKRNAVINADSLYIENLKSFNIPWHRGVDIDTKKDFVLAEGIKRLLDLGFSFDTGEVS